VNAWPPWLSSQARRREGGECCCCRCCCCCCWRSFAWLNNNGFDVECMFAF
jgi:hypothetical protein